MAASTPRPCYSPSTGELFTHERPWDEQRPRTRADCIGRPRPCPWVSCKHHLLVDVTPAGGIVVNAPAISEVERGRNRLPVFKRNELSRCEVDEVVLEELDRAERQGWPTCALDVVEENGPITLERVATILCITREGVRQLEAGAITQIQSDSSEELAEYQGWPDRMSAWDLWG